MRVPVHVVTRLRLDVELYQPALPRHQTDGRPRKVSDCQVSKLLDNPTHPWQTVIEGDWYGQGDYTLSPILLSGIKPECLVPIRWVLIQTRRASLRHKRCYVPTLQPLQDKSYNGFGSGGRLVSFEEVRTHLGLRPNVSGPPWRLSAPHLVLLWLFSIVTTLAHQQLWHHPFVLPKVALSLGATDFRRCTRASRQQFGRCGLFRCPLQHQTLLKFP